MTEDLLSRNYMSEMRPCCFADCQIGSDFKLGNQAKPLEYSEKSVVFRTKLEQMFKCKVTELDT